MRDVKSRFKENPSMFAWILGSLALGLVLLIWPTLAVDSVFAVASLVLAATGGVYILQYIRWDAKQAVGSHRLVIGILLALAGILLFCLRGPLIAFVPFVFGLYLLVGGVIKVQAAFDMRRMGEKKWFFSLIGAGLSLLMGLIVVFNPFGAAMTLTRFIGAALIVEAVQDAAFLIKAGKVRKSFFR